MYCPPTEGRKPVVVGFPGFATTADEYGRTDRVLEELSKRGIVGVKFAHSSVQKEGTRIVAPFMLEEYVAEYAEAIEYASGRDDVDKGRIGVIASSISATIVAYLLAREYNGRKLTASIRCAAFTAPVTGWNHLYDAQKREQLTRLQDAKPDWHLDISTPEDKMGSISRMIPGRSVAEFMKLDPLRMLESGITHGGLEVLTIGGDADTTVNPASFPLFHSRLGGQPGNIFIYSGQSHYVDLRLYEKAVIDFFTAHLNQ